MSLLDVLRSGVRTADKVTKPLQATVMFQHCTGMNQYGATYDDDPVPLAAIVDQREQLVRTPSGQLQAAKAQITFLDVASLAAAISPDLRVKETDLVVLPDGTGGSIISIGGFVDAGTGGFLATQVFLG